jgi:asparagine synthase (glutamine-hydrolysing)
MCGICGWISLDSRADSIPSGSDLDLMTSTIEHRGPDDWGVAAFEKSAIGMTRLSIIDLGGGHQPIANEDKDCSIVFNGEIYNFLDLRRELEAKGRRFRTRSDTEVILRAYEEWGVDCVSRLRGMFAFAIYDGRHSTIDPRAHPMAGPRLFLARDRVGKKPLYYYQDGKILIFASEIKAILAHRAVRRHVNRAVIPLYLAYGYVPTPLTIFEDIYELPPGHTLAVNGGNVAVNRYWEIPPNCDCGPVLSERQYIDQLRELFEDAVRIRLGSDVPLGAFLSGGVDSAAVVAIMVRLMDQPVRTFAIGFSDDTSFNELEYARLVANTYGTDHHEFVVKPDAIELLPKIVWHYDQPFADSSAVPTYLVAQLTREHVKVALTGDGGDELFAGYERFAAARMAENYRRTPHLLQNTVKQCLDIMPEATTYRSFVRRARRFVDSAALPLPERYLHWVGIFPPSLTNELLTAEGGADPVSHFQAYFDPACDSDLIGQLLSVNMKTYLTGDLLVKTDRMTMANSLEARCPFLDHQLLEYACGIPSDLKLNGMTTKYILKRAMRDIVPPEIIRRKKHGFGVPIGQWFRTSLKDYVRDLLLSPNAVRRGYFREEVLRGLLDEHQTGKRDHGHRLWALLTFEVWHRVFIDQELSPSLVETSKTGLMSVESLTG